MASKFWRKIISDLEFYTQNACRGKEEIFRHSSSQKITFPYVFSHKVTEGCVTSKQDIYPKREVKGISKMFANEDSRLKASQQDQIGVSQRSWDRNI